MRLTGSPGLAQRIVLIIGIAAALVALGRYLETIGHNDVSFGWFAYAPLNSSAISTFRARPPSVDLAIWGGASVVWALASLRLIGSSLGRRIVLVVAMAGLVGALGFYLQTLAHRSVPGLQFLSSTQRAQLGGAADPGSRFEIWLGLAVVWTIGSVILLRRQRTLQPAAERLPQSYPSSPHI
jgi:hypothetical protein